MKAGLLLQFSLVVLLLLVNSTEGFFLDPKKVLMDFLQSLKEKKEAKKKPPGNNIRHYHVHYHPSQIHVISGISAKAPEKHELDKVHNEHLSSLGWSDYEYKYIPEPKITVSSRLHHLWDDVPNPVTWSHGIIETSLSDRIDRSENQGILVQVPLNQPIIIKKPQSNQKLKTSLLAAFFQKMASSQNSVHE